MKSMPDWKRVYHRLRTMEPAEVADRIRQQTTARVDWLRYKTGRDFAPQFRNTTSTQPHFFFAPQAVPALCSRLRELFPDTVAQIVERAERICQHRFDLMRQWHGLVAQPRARGHTQIEARLQVVELGALDEAIERRRHLGAAQRVRPVVILPSYDRPARGALGPIVGKGDPGVIEEEHEAGP